MDADLLFRKYLATWPDAWIMWPDGKDGKGKEKMKSLFAVEEGDPLSPHFTFNDVLDYIKEESIKEKRIPPLCSSEWLAKYFKTFRGRKMAHEHLQRHETTMAIVMFNTPPFKALMDGFFEWVIDTEVKPCLTV
jgi:hypothetical protein